MRYHRQELIIGKENQDRLRKASVLVVGLGALGSVAAELLCRSGIGKLILIDRDEIELTNLQRQSLYVEEDVGMFKAEVADGKLKGINSEVDVESYVADLTYRNISEFSADVILDCTDNFQTRRLINDYAKKMKTPWVYSGCIKDHGNVMSVYPDGPCFECVFGDMKTNETCDTVGILNSASHAIASLAVSSVLKILFGEKDTALYSLNVWDVSLAKVQPEKKEGCVCCEGTYEYLSGKGEQKTVKYCGGDRYQFYLDFDYEEVKERLSSQNVKIGDYYLILDELSIFSDGRVVVRAKEESHAKSLISKYLGI